MNKQDINNIDYDRVPVGATHTKFINSQYVFYKNINNTWLVLVCGRVWEESDYQCNGDKVALPKFWSETFYWHIRNGLKHPLTRQENGILYALIDNPAYIKQEEQKMTTKQFTRADLKTGMRVTLRNGSSGVVMLNFSSRVRGLTDIVLVGDGWLDLSDSLKCGLPHHDIVKVEQRTYPGSLSSGQYTLLWEETSEKQTQYNEILAKIEILDKETQALRKQAEAFKP